MELTLAFSAYMAESIRLRYFWRGPQQWESAQAVGMTKFRLMRQIILHSITRRRATLVKLL